MSGLLKNRLDIFFGCRFTFFNTLFENFPCVSFRQCNLQGQHRQF